MSVIICGGSLLSLTFFKIDLSNKILGNKNQNKKKRINQCYLILHYQMLYIYSFQVFIFIAFNYSWLPQTWFYNYNSKLSSIYNINNYIVHIYTKQVRSWNVNNHRNIIFKFENTNFCTYVITIYLWTSLINYIFRMVSSTSKFRLSAVLNHN